MSVQDLDSLGVAVCPRAGCTTRVADDSLPCAGCLADYWSEDPRTGGGPQ